MTNQEAVARAKETIGKSSFPAFATVDENGCPQCRAMMPVLVDDDLTVYYITSRQSAKCSQIKANPMASTLWTEVVEPMRNWRSVLVKGKASVSDDKALRDKFWMEELRGFFPGGADDPNFVVVVVKPSEMIMASAGEMQPVVVKM
jgi:general stress protein 26